MKVLSLAVIFSLFSSYTFVYAMQDQNPNTQVNSFLGNYKVMSEQCRFSKNLSEEEYHTLVKKIQDNKSRANSSNIKHAHAWGKLEAQLKKRHPRDNKKPRSLKPKQLFAE